MLAGFPLKYSEHGHLRKRRRSEWWDKKRTKEDRKIDWGEKHGVQKHRGVTPGGATHMDLLGWSAKLKRAM